MPSDKSKALFSPYFPSSIPLVTAASLGLDRSLRQKDKNNFAPRFGFSYQLDGSGKTVLRGGWGIYYDHLSANVNSGLSTGPFAISTTATNNVVNGNPQFNLANPFALPGAASTLDINAVSQRLLNAYVQQYSLTVERVITKDIGLRVSYLGSISRFHRRRHSPRREGPIRCSTTLSMRITARTCCTAPCKRRSASASARG